MKQEIDLMHNYPRSKRNVEGRGATKKPAGLDKCIAGVKGDFETLNNGPHGYIHKV